jgi:hypothetical protein
MLSWSIYRPGGCEYRLVFKQPPGETNIIVIDGYNIILPPPSVPLLLDITNPAPSVRFDVDVITGDSFRIAWPTASNQIYRLLFSDDAKQWQLNPIRFAGTGGEIGFDVRLNADKSFYRVMLE